MNGAAGFGAMDFCGGIAKLAEHAEADAARRPRVLGDHDQLTDPPLPGQNHRADGVALGADGRAVADVLEVAAAEHLPPGRAQGGADGVAAVGGVGGGARGGRGGQQVFGDHGVIMGERRNTSRSSS